MQVYACLLINCCASQQQSAIAQLVQQVSLPYHLEASQLLGVCIGICAIRQQAGVVAVNDVVNLVLCKQLLNKLR
jgi:hypothetical protein